MRNNFSIEEFCNNMINSCDKLQVKDFEKNEVITTYIVNRNLVCIVLEGSADLMRYDFPNLVLSKVSDLNLRIELLSKKSIRDKLISYFRILSEKNFSKTFTLPLSLTDLADYLSVDRSAMMRELKILKDDGFINKTGKNKITLLT